MEAIAVLIGACVVLVMLLVVTRRAGAIGEPDRELIVEPLEEPVPKSVPAPVVEPVRDPSTSSG